MKIDKYFKGRGYSIEREFCGYPERRYVVRFFGEFICQAPTMKEAELEMIYHDSDQIEKQTGIKLI